MRNFKKALDIVRNKIKTDNELYESYKVNIAMAFFDECKKNKIYSSKLLAISNDAADNFLKLWLK
jgi:hypothetical protein